MKVNIRDLKYLVKTMRYMRDIDGLPVRAGLKDGLIVWYWAANDEEAEKYREFTDAVFTGKLDMLLVAEVNRANPN